MINGSSDAVANNISLGSTWIVGRKGFCFVWCLWISWIGFSVPLVADEPADPETYAGTWIRFDPERCQAPIEKFLRQVRIPADRLAALNWGESSIHSELMVLFESVGVTGNCLQKIEQLDAVRDQKTDLEAQLAEIHKAIQAIGTPAVREQVQLQLAVQLVKLDLHDSADSILDGIDPTRLAQPALAVFFRTICAHQTVESGKRKSDAAMLVQHIDELPVRYREMAKSLYGEIQVLEKDPLQQVYRLMDDVQRRQSLRESSDRVLKEEKRIVQQLDKLINQMEQQKKKNQSMAKSQGRPKSSSPNEDQGKMTPTAGGPKNKGDVTAKNQDSDSDWGQLSAEEKAIAVESLVRDLPPHFQALLKAYFQKLAEEKKR